MRTLVLLTLTTLPALTACTADDSDGKGDCDADFYGYACPSDDAMAALDRVDEVRSEAGLPWVGLEARLDQAAQAHADYMAEHSVLDHYEDSADSGYTGDWVWDRMESAGYPLEAGFSWSEVVAWGGTPVESVNIWVDSVYHRIPFLSPELVEVGFGFNDTYAGMAIVAPYPDRGRASALWPADGATDVPTSFDSDTEWPDPAPSAGVVGYPISVSLGAPSVSGSGDNPYDIQVIDATLTSSAGDVDFTALAPSTDSYMWNMVALLPTEPLDSGTTYDVSMTVSWGGSEEDFAWSFTTR